MIKMMVYLGHFIIFFKKTRGNNLKKKLPRDRDLVKTTIFRYVVFTGDNISFARDNFFLTPYKTQ